MTRTAVRTFAWPLVLLMALTSGMGLRASAQSSRPPAASRGQQDIAEEIRTRKAAVLVVEVASGRVLMQVGDVSGESAPGSVVKPFVLREALESGVVNERTTVHCTGMLRVAGHNLACVHPRDVTVLDAREALAESCNTYFASVARRMPVETLVAALRGAGLRVSAAAASEARVPSERELMGLGLLGVQVSVRELAEAYRALAVWMESASAPAMTVRDGLVASVNTGAARAAHVDGRTVAGKTGTVDEAGTGRSHGWFAGVVYGTDHRPELVLVVRMTAGNGRDAAAMARQLLVQDL